MNPIVLVQTVKAVVELYLWFRKMRKEKQPERRED